MDGVVVVGVVGVVGVALADMPAGCVVVAVVAVILLSLHSSIVARPLHMVAESNQEVSTFVSLCFSFLLLSLPMLA